MPKGFLLKEGVLFPTYSTWSIVYIKKKTMHKRGKQLYHGSQY